ncbi:AGE family epimerase/isomerase [Stappia sp.]|uniref:AGE family epimerase/isomerase n=1 Tax=Stappia sp. TaxID=1870903 RepID=UPI0032D97270
MRDTGGDLHTALTAARDRLRHWLLRESLPLWTSAGVDPATGGFRESLDRRTGAPTAAPTRPRVPPRQIYAVLTGAALGWQGPAEALALRALADYHRRFRVADGTLRPEPVVAGGVRPCDLYDQAFALFAYAALAEAVPAKRPAMEAEAAHLLATLRERLRHPAGGFQEDAPPRLPLRANPHMHLFEAALAWEAVTEDAAWPALADEIAGLALARFIDAETGALREFFAADWTPMPDETGRIVEPGHQFEWAWLLRRWGLKRDRQDALAAARRLFAIGCAHGICPQRKMAVLSLTDDFAVLDPVARLWSQTEWLKASLAMGEIAETAAERAACRRQALDAVAALERFLDTETPGTFAGAWHDRLGPDGTFVDEPAPASSFYHIVCAISELDAVLARGGV